MKRIILLLIITCLFFQVSGKTVHGSGSDSLPEIEEVRVFDVKGVQDMEREGELVDEGLNITINSRHVDFSTYRFTFVVNNTGDKNFLINSSDELFHKGLDSSWDVDEPWYNVSKDRNYGGVFTGTTVEWDTGNQGVVEPGELLFANYIVNISSDEDVDIPQRFKVNDTKWNTGSEDFHRFEIRKLGKLNTTIFEPPNDTIVKKNSFFKANSSVECLSGYCGNANTSVRDNSTEGFSSIEEGSGTPFHTNQSNFKSCGVLSEGEKCFTNWSVNATGDLESFHEIDVNSTSNYSKIEENSSEDNLVQINKVILMNLGFSEISFGFLDPGAEKRPAEKNDDGGYNISVQENSIGVDNLYIKSSPLVSKKDSNYEISPLNISWTDDREAGEKKNLSSGFKKIFSDISPGSMVSNFFFIDIPLGMTEGDYEGNITFKANSTF